MSYPYYKTLEKHYEGVEDFAVDLAANLSDGETISASDVDVVRASNGVVGDLTLSGVTQSGTNILFRATGGKCGTKIDDDRWETEYILRAKCTSSSGETLSVLVRLIVFDFQERT